ncbi:hypothetical protein FZEAL_5845 [Fusarium zealandicum]|uniref:Uncharacterized protein n=1 Tax=Fusarium zealandicum TaxID=1053134 RepID=A0A8H4UIW7_9HYPO|nr:hypothetical protein FZEAL_5845 [Fusarium zealandicum]
MLLPLFAGPDPQPETRSKPRPRKTASRKPAPKQFEFVSSDPAGKPALGTRKFIRSHVMRGKNTKRRAASTQVILLNETAPDAHQQVEDTEIIAISSSRGELHPTDEYFKAMQQYRAWIQSPSRIAPVNAPPDLSLFNFATPLDGNSRYLIFRFLTSLKETTYPAEWCFDPDRTKVCWFRWLLQDATYLHSVLFMVSAFQDLLARRSSGEGDDIELGEFRFSPETHRHLRKTIHLLQDKIQDGQRQLEDTTASAIIALAMMADTVGDAQAFEAHSKGLRDIIKMRGGLQGFKHNRQVQIKLCRVDLGWSIKNGCRPEIWKGDVSWEPLFENVLHMSAPTLEAPSSDFLATTASWDYRLLNVFKDLRDFSGLANQLMTGREKLRPEHFQEMMLSIQYRLLLLDYTIDANPLHEAIRLGLLAFEATLFIKLPGCKFKSAQFAEQIRDAIEAVPVDGETVANIKLWLLLIGSIMVFEGSESWLVQSIQSLVGRQTWAEVRKRVKQIVWVDSVHDIPGRKAFEATLRGHVE